MRPGSGLAEWGLATAGPLALLPLLRHVLDASAGRDAPHRRPPLAHPDTSPRPAPGDLPDLLEDLLIGSSGSGCLLQWVVPAEVRGGCYADLVEHLIDRHSALAIGLLRAGVLTASPLPYVLTNPPPDTPLQEAAPPRRGGHR